MELRNLVQLEGEMVGCAMEDKLGTTGRKDGETVRWKRNLVQLEGEMVDSAMEDKLGTTGRRDGGQCDGR